MAALPGLKRLLSVELNSLAVADRPAQFGSQGNPYQAQSFYSIRPGGDELLELIVFQSGFGQFRVRRFSWTERSEARPLDTEDRTTTGVDVFTRVPILFCTQGKRNLCREDEDCLFSTKLLRPFAYRRSYIFKLSDLPEREVAAAAGPHGAGHTGTPKLLQGVVFCSRCTGCKSQIPSLLIIIYLSTSELCSSTFFFPCPRLLTESVIVITRVYMFSRTRKDSFHRFS